MVIVSSMESVIVVVRGGRDGRSWYVLNSVKMVSNGSKTKGFSVTYSKNAISDESSLICVKPIQ